MSLYNYINSAIGQRWEHWHWLAKYAPIVPSWLVCCAKGKSWWYFSAANPYIIFSGFIKQGKWETYQKLPATSFPDTILIHAGSGFAEVQKQVTAAGFGFPCVVKPDKGQMGLLFRIIENWEALSSYHNQMPLAYLVQQFVAWPIEVSVYYYRYPNTEHGYITGFVRKEGISVVGNGKNTLLELIESHPIARYKIEGLSIRHAEFLTTVIEEGKSFSLIQAFNLSQGGRLISLKKEIDCKLVSVFDLLSHQAEFYFGRYDIKCKSITDLKEGKNFSILELNGCGAEPHHVYGNGNTLAKAYRVLVLHWRALLKVSLRQNQLGAAAIWQFWPGLLFTYKAYTHYRLLKRLEKQIT